MNRLILIAVLIMGVTTPLAAQDRSRDFDFGGDSFHAGGTVVFDSEGTDDLFMAGETVQGKQAISGSAHLAGRTISMSGAIGGDAYLAGADVTLDGAVIGDASLAGRNVQVGTVGGDLRIAGENLVISGPVSGYAMIAGETVAFNSVITGDVSLAAQTVEFSESARIEGRLTIYEEELGQLDIPVNVVPEDRIDRRDVSEWSDADEDGRVADWRRRASAEFLGGVAFIAALAALIAAFAPKKLANLRQNILDRPFRNLFFGFLALSAVIGSTVILIMTVIGWLLVPVTVSLALFSAFAGYVVAAYAFGVGFLKIFGRSEPDSFLSRALAAGVGAFVVAIIGLIPFLGWLFVLTVALVGVGAISIWLFQPKFFATA